LDFKSSKLLSSTVQEYPKALTFTRTPPDLV